MPAHAEPLAPILVALSGTPSGQRALDRAIELAEQSGADLVGIVLHGRLPVAPIAVAEVDAERARTERFFDAIGRLAVDQAAEHGLELELLHQHGPLGRALRRTLQTREVSVVVVGRPAGWPASLRTVWGLRTVSCSILLAS